MENNFDDTIIDMFNKGCSINVIAKYYYNQVNRHSHAIVTRSGILIPKKLYNKTDCKLYVTEVIYNYVISSGVRT